MWFKIERKAGGKISIAYLPKAGTRTAAVPILVNEQQATAIRDLLSMALTTKDFTMEIATEDNG